MTNGTSVAMNCFGDVLEDGAVAVGGSTIVAVGSSQKLAVNYETDRIIDEDGHAVLPGFVTPHMHVSDILLRGLGSKRQLYDWLYNIKTPGTNPMTREEHAIASKLYAREAVRSGITTFVEFGVGGESGYDDSVIQSKFDTYERIGLRNI